MVDHDDGLSAIAAIGFLAGYSCGRCLLVSREQAEADEEVHALFLQAKEVEASVLEPFLAKSRFTNHGQRVVEGQRLIQSARDITLGWIHGPGADAVERDFYLRQLWDAKGSAEIETMTPRTMRAYAEICGWTLRRRTPGPATRSRSGAISVPAMFSRVRSPRSPSCMRTRTT